MVFWKQWLRAGVLLAGHNSIKSRWVVERTIAWLHQFR